ncbi:protein DpdH [Variovorax humicola]|uniref:Protein DpdH n=1 Tax=Variovorax humicola TaxID=1769758 RepID=A0ABU8WB03_9BURK
MSELLDYWPSAERVNECLRTEAETIDEALLLAVHEPATLRRRAAHTGLEVDATEKDLLDALMRPSNDGSAVLVAITGASGVGKSHMVRWLRAQLLRHPMRDRLVIVSIPKTASLRQVVERMLEPLGGQAYAAIKNDLDRAVEALKPTQAAELLATTLAGELETFASNLQEEVRANSVAREHAPRINIARKVRTLVRDPQVRDSWLQEVMIRIIQSSLDGAADPDQRRFHARDFVPPPTIANNTFQPETNSVLTFLARNDGADRTAAAEILQEVLDPALRSVFGFTETFRQKTIQEIVGDIRRQLLAEKRELVLLVEDLAALAGIQQPLLDIVIAESDDQGRRVRAPIRTALAVTDGFLPGRQTLLTRAKAEWVIPSEGLADEVVVARLVRLTGRYLNAARWGLGVLKKRFAEVPPDEQNLYTWVPVFDEDLEAASADQLEAFGKTKAKHALFPFSEVAVRSFAEQALKRGGQWVFNPRAYIDAVLHPVLKQRNLFARGQFPAALPADLRVVSEVGLALSYKGYSPAELKQVEAAVFYWAGNPDSLSKTAPVSKQVFDALNVKWPFDSSAVPGRPPVKKPPIDGVGTGQGPQSPVPPPAPPPPAPGPEVSDFAKALESWGPTTRLTGTVPNRVRKLLEDSLNQRIDPDLLRLHGEKVDSKWFWLPPSTTTSNPSAGIVIRVAAVDQPIPPLVIGGLRALDRWDLRKQNWDYEGAEDDYAAAHALLDVLEPQTTDQLSERAVADVAVLSVALHRQGLLLGLSRSAEPDATRALKQLAQPAVSNPPMDLATDTNPFVRRVTEFRTEAARARTVLQDQLRFRLGCYQGNTGGKVLAVDTQRFKQAWKAPTPKIFALTLKSKEAVGADAADALERMSNASLTQVLAALQKAQELYRPRIAEAFDDDHARVAWRTHMLDTLEQSRTLSLWPSECNEKHVRKAIEELSSDGLEGLFKRARQFSPPDDSQSLDVRLEGWSSMQLPDLKHVAESVDTLEHYFSALERTCGKQTDSFSDEALVQREAFINSLGWEA